MENTITNETATLEKALADTNAQQEQQAEEIKAQKLKTADVTANHDVLHLRKQLAEAQELLDQQAETIAQQQAQYEAVVADPAVRPTVKVGKDTYRVGVEKFRYKRTGDGCESTEYTAAELVKDAELAKELVGKKVGFLELIKPK